MPAQKRADVRVELIFEATEHAIANRGYDRVRFADVAAIAGVSIGSLQRRFGTLEALLRATMKHVDARERDRWLDLARGIDDPWDRLIALLRNVLALAHGDPEDQLWLQVLAVGQRDETLRSDLQTQQDLWTMTFTQVVAEGMANGQMTSDLTAREAGLALLALTDGFYLARHIGNTPPDIETTGRIAETVARCVLRRPEGRPMEGR
ncbi:hypothetical protein BH11ACT6_BH11ACT6_47300 [soil metagenome]